MNALIILTLAISALTLIAVIYLLNKKGNAVDVSAEIKKVLDSQANQNANSVQNMLVMLEKIAGLMREEIKGLASGTSENLKGLEGRIAELRKTLEDGIRYMHAENKKALAEIRETVDEKLSVTLERRLGESFEVISKRLEAVYKGIGEVQAIASSVGDLKNVLTNVKVRGTYGETQLNALLEQMLAPSQYAKSVKVNPTANEMVDFAIILPGKDDGNVLLPIDSKFPIEDYQRLLSAYENNDSNLLEKAKSKLAQSVKLQATSISSKYIYPPRTTDFAIMYVALEGLYAEILRNDDLMAHLNKQRIMVCGPTNLGALLNSLQTGFKTLSIEKRSGELWQLLSAFKVEFMRFEGLLEKTQKKLYEASNTIEEATKKTRTIGRKLKGVDVLEEDKASLLLEEDGEN